MTLDVSPQIEALLTAKAHESGLSVEAFIESLISDDRHVKSVPIDKPLKLPVWDLGARGELHRRDIYEDEC